MLRVSRLRPRLSLRAVLSATLVLALSGFLFATSARLARGDQGRAPEDLPQLLSSESGRVDRLSAEAARLTTEIDDLVAAAEAGPDDPNLSAAVGVQVGTVPVSGPGLTVSLNDAPPGTPYPEGRPQNAKWLVVHQGDVQAVVNALWAGGAEAMTLQGQRVTPTSAFRCVGNTLLLHGRVFSPPYVVRAIGDPETLQAGLDASSAVQAFVDAQAWGLGWAVESAETIDMPRYEGDLDLTYATAIREES